MLTVKRLGRILNDMKPLNVMLHDWREAVKLSGSEAARRCNMSPQHWWMLEQGDRAALRISTIQKLADGTGLPLERLMAAAELSRKNREAVAV